MELHFNTILILCSKLGNENSDAGHIKCSRRLHLAWGPQVPYADLYPIAIAVSYRIK